ncbi:hypothetical protein PGTUg99_007872 [Puccinia graminis f. sp. tritici]|uniref:Uncharacterized protein n=1 Tax=Puccinia graminis f. sp. tritici TaxID=56615 RepID=A0A5B0R6D1_PUCGR|nr:hypothetical protein PGTUg99_007872 [Puccinia graminis f. sp. tritici]
MLSIVKGHHICCTYLDRICPHEPSRANGGNNGRAPVRSKPPTSCSNTGGAHRRKQSNASLEPTELNPRLPSTALISKYKPVRLARRNESLLSVNGSPAVSYAPNEIPGWPNSTSAATIISSKSSELFPARSTSSSSLALDHHHLICCTYLELIEAGYQSNRTIASIEALLEVLDKLEKDFEGMKTSQRSNLHTIRHFMGLNNFSLPLFDLSEIILKTVT